MKIPPWFLILAGWGVLIGATVMTVRICIRNAPVEVPLEHSSKHNAGNAD
jgi:hypothetical protein